VIFGLADGAMSILGVVFYASGHGGMVIPLAISGGLSAACSMAGGEWLSDSENGPGASAAMGAATLIGSVLPAAPYAVLSGWHAPAVSVLTLAAVVVVVAHLRSRRKHPYAETFGVLAVVLAASAACALLIPAA
jgi:VIT1/CCC1 family predicted Fe2+/Mn2+ transporter